MGITVGLMPKVSAAETKAVMDTVKKKDKVADTIKVIDGKFQTIKQFNKKKKADLPMVLSSSKKEVENFMKALENYLADFNIIPEGKTTAEKVKWLNEVYLGIETENPTFITPETIQALDGKMIALNATLQDDIIADAAAEMVSSTESEYAPAKPAGPAAEEEEAETLPAITVTPKEMSLVSKTLIGRIDAAIAECEKYSLTDQKEKLESYKNRILKLHEEEKPISKKLNKEINDYLAGVNVKINSAKKKAEETPVEVTEEIEAPAPVEAAAMSEAEKLNYMKYFVGFLKNGTVLQVPVLTAKNKTNLKKFPDLSEKESKKAKKKENVKNMKLFRSAIKKINKGEMPTAEEEAMFFEVVNAKIQDAGHIFVNTTYEQQLDQIYSPDMANMENMKEAADFLTKVADKFVEDGVERLKIQVDLLNQLRPGNKLTIPEDYDLTTVEGTIQLLQWVSKKEYETYALIARNNVDNAELSAEAEAAVSQMAELRQMRVNLYNTEQAAASMPPQEYVVMSKEEKKNFMESSDYTNAVTFLENAIDAVEAESPDEPSLKVAKDFLEAAKDADNAYAKDPKKILASANYLLVQQEYKFWLSISGEVGTSAKAKNQGKFLSEWAADIYARSFNVSSPIYEEPVLATRLMESALLSVSPYVLSFSEFDVMEKNQGASADVWNTLIMGSIGAIKAGVPVPVPVIQETMNTLYSIEVFKSEIHPAWNRVELTGPAFGTPLTTGQVYPSYYGSTIGILEAQTGKIPPEKWNDYYAKLGEGAATYHEGYNKVSPPANDVKKGIIDYKVDVLDEILTTGYGIGLAPLEGVEYGAVVVRPEMLAAFDEKNVATTEKGKVTATEGETLKSVKFANMYYEATRLVETEENYKDLKYKDAKAKAEELLDFLQENLTDEAKKDPGVNNAIGSLMIVGNKADYVAALVALHDAGESLGLSKIYVFDNSEAEDRFYWVKKVEDSVTDIDKEFNKSQVIATLDLAIEDARTLHDLMDDGRISFFIPKGVEPPIKEPEPIIYEAMGPYPEIAAEQQPPVNIVYAAAEEPQLVADISKIDDYAQQALGGKENAERVIDVWTDILQEKPDSPDEVAGAASDLRESLLEELTVGSSSDKDTYNDAMDKLARVADPDDEKYGDKELFEEAMDDLRDISTIGGQLDSAYTEWVFKADRNTVSIAKLGGEIELHLINPVIFEKIQKGEMASGFVEAFLTMGYAQLETPGEWLEYAQEGSEKVPTGEKAKGKAVEREGTIGAGAKFAVPISEKVQSFFGKNMLLTVKTEAEFGEEEVSGEVPKGEEGGTQKVKSKSQTGMLSDLSLSIWFPDSIALKGLGGGVANLYGAPGGFESITPYMYGTLGYDLKTKKDIFLGWYTTGGVLIPIKEGDAEAAPFVGGSMVVGAPLNDNLYLFTSGGVTGTFNSLGGLPSLTLHGAADLYFDAAGLSLGVKGEYTHNQDSLDKNMGAVTGVIKLYFGVPGKKKKKEKKAEEKEAEEEKEGE